MIQRKSQRKSQHRKRTSVERATMMFKTHRCMVGYQLEKKWRHKAEGEKKDRRLEPRIQEAGTVDVSHLDEVLG